MSMPNAVNVFIYTDGEIIEESNSVRYSNHASTNMRIRRTIKFVELLKKLYARTRIDENQFCLKVFIKYEFERRNVMRESIMQIKDDESLSFFLDPDVGQSTVELYIEKELIQPQGQDTSLLTEVTSLTPNQMMPFYAQSALPYLNTQSQLHVLKNCASTSGHSFGSFEDVQNSPLENHCLKSFEIPDVHAGTSTHNYHDFEHHNFGPSDFADIGNDHFEDDNDSVHSPCSVYDPSDSDLEEHLNNIPMDEENDEINVFINEDVPPTRTQERLHEVLPFYSTIHPEVQGDSLDQPSSSVTRSRIYDSAKGNLGLGLVFDNKQSLQTAVKNYHVRHVRRKFRVTLSNPTMYCVECKHKGMAMNCDFKLRGRLEKKSDFWQITRYQGPHTCLFEDVSKNHVNLDINMIANELLPIVAKDPSYKIKLIVLMVKKKWGYDITNVNAWYSLRRANEVIYGTWENSVTWLPEFLGAIQKFNPGTVVEWQHKRPNQNPKMLKFVFWAFRPCIDGFQHCRRVICVDGTHLYARHKAKILIATTVDGNQNILPLAFAIVDNKSNESWLWFLKLVSKYFVRSGEGVCLISDRHNGLLHATRHLPAFSPPLGAHRFCLRHLTSNFNSHFKNKVMKELCYEAGMAHKVRKFDNAMDAIGKMDEAALNYLKAIPKKKWTLAYDGGKREGIMTTNMGESLKYLLKGTRHLPPTAIVECTFHRVVEYFADRVRLALAMRERPMTTYAYAMYNEWTKKSLRHSVQVFSWSQHTGQVKTPRRIGTGTFNYIVEIKEKYCSCGKWTLHRIPCSHAIALCKTLGIRPTSLVEKYYLVDEYLKTYQGRFNPLPEEHYWDTPNFELVHDPDLMKLPSIGRHKSTQIPNEMDW